FLENAVQVLRPAGDFATNAGAVQQTAHQGDELVDVTLAIDAPFGQATRQVAIGGRIDAAKRQVFELPLELPDPEPVGKRREHLERLAAERFATGLGQVARIPEQLHLAGQPHQYHAHVVDHGDQHLAEVLVRVPGEDTLGEIRDHVHAAYSLDQRGDGLAEGLAKLVRTEVDHLRGAVQPYGRLGFIVGVDGAGYLETLGDRGFERVRPLAGDAAQAAAAPACDRLEGGGVGKESCRFGVLQGL